MATVEKLRHWLGDRLVTRDEWFAVIGILEPFEVDTADIVRCQVIDGERTEWPEGWAPPRMVLIRHLVRNGEIHEG